MKINESNSKNEFKERDNDEEDDDEKNTQINFENENRIIKRFYCNHKSCGKSFNSENRLKIHIQTHV